MADSRNDNSLFIFNLNSFSSYKLNSSRKTKCLHKILENV